MEKCRVFIASSGRTLTLAEKLGEALNAAIYDFAVVILAEDDVMNLENHEVRKARDNCVFEAGLFMAALGRDRVFLVNSVEQKYLPSDFGGIITERFTEPCNLKNRAECGEAVKKVAGFILDKVQFSGKLSRRLTQARLLAREKLRDLDPDGELIEDQVVVLSVQPFELEYEAAVQVRENIDRGVQYVYLLEGSPNGASKVCQLLQMIFLSPFLNKESAVNSAKREAVLEEEQVRENILRDMEMVSRRRRLKAFFLPTRPVLQYCIHNAKHVDYAVLYLRQGDEFVEWGKGQLAHDFWEQERTKVELYDLKRGIFHGSPGFDLEEPDFRNALEAGLNDYFPNCPEEVTRICLEGVGR
jgi:hypothetical protein